jgi:hypothetical protein
LVSNQSLVTKVVEFTSRIQTKLVWLFSEFSKNFYKFLKITDFELRGGTEILQLGPQEELNQSNWVLGSTGKRIRGVPDKFRRWRSPVARGNRPGGIRELGWSLLVVMCRSGLAGGGGMVVMELNHGGGVPAWRRTSSGSEVGEKLQESKEVRLITLVRAGTAGGMGSHGDPGRRRRGSSSARWMQCLRAVLEGLVSFTGSRRSY